MLNNKMRAELDQSCSMMCELFPPLWYGLYVALLDQGFLESQALELVKVYILSQGKNHIALGE